MPKVSSLHRHYLSMTIRHRRVRRWWVPWSARCSCGIKRWPCPDGPDEARAGSSVQWVWSLREARQRRTLANS
jgi:hypothetical protein